jgi:hypothetical protein
MAHDLRFALSTLLSDRLFSAGVATLALASFAGLPACWIAAQKTPALDPIKAIHYE